MDPDFLFFERIEGEFTEYMLPKIPMATERIAVVGIHQKQRFIEEFLSVPKLSQEQLSTLFHGYSYICASPGEIKKSRKNTFNI